MEPDAVEQTKRCSCRHEQLQYVWDGMCTKHQKNPIVFSYSFSLERGLRMDEYMNVIAIKATLGAS